MSKVLNRPGVLAYIHEKFDVGYIGFFSAYKLFENSTALKQAIQDCLVDDEASGRVCAVFGKPSHI